MPHSLGFLSCLIQLQEGRGGSLNEVLQFDGNRFCKPKWMKQKFRDLKIPEAKLKYQHPRREEYATEKEEIVSSP